MRVSSGISRQNRDIHLFFCFVLSVYAGCHLKEPLATFDQCQTLFALVSRSVDYLDRICRRNCEPRKADIAALPCRFRDECGLRFLGSETRLFSNTDCDQVGNTCRVQGPWDDAEVWCQPVRCLSLQLNSLHTRHCQPVWQRIEVAAIKRAISR